MGNEDDLFYERRYKLDNLPKILEVHPGLIYRVRELHTNVIDLASVVFPVVFDDIRNRFLEHLDRCLQKDSKLLFPVEGSKCCALHDGKWIRVIIKHVVPGRFRIAESVDFGWRKFMVSTSFSETPQFFDLIKPMAFHIKFSDNANSFYKTCDTEEYFIRFLEWKPDKEHWIVEFIGFPRYVERSPSNAVNAAMSQIAELEKKREIWKYRQASSDMSDTPDPFPNGFAEEPFITHVMRNATEAANEENAAREIESEMKNITLSENAPNMNLIGSGGAPSTGKLPSNAAEAVEPTITTGRKKNWKGKQQKLRWQTDAEPKDLAEAKPLAQKSANTELNDKDSKLRGAELLELGGTQVQNEANQVDSDGAQSVQAGIAASTKLSSIEFQELQTVLHPTVPLTPDEVLSRSSVYWEFAHVEPNHVVMNVVFCFQPPIPFDICGYVCCISVTDATHFLNTAVLAAARELLRIIFAKGNGTDQSSVTFQNESISNGPCISPMTGCVWNQYSQNRAHDPSRSTMLLQHSTTLTENNGGIQNDAAPVDSSLDDRPISKSLPVLSKDLPKSEDGKPPQILGHLKANPNQNPASSRTHTNPSFTSPDFLPTVEPQSNQICSNPGSPLHGSYPFQMSPVDHQTHAFSHPSQFSIPLNSDNLHPTPSQPMVQPVLNSSVQSPPNFSPFIGSSFQHQYVGPPIYEYHLFRDPSPPAYVVSNGYPNQTVGTTPMLPHPHPIPSSVPVVVYVHVQPVSGEFSVVNPLDHVPLFGTPANAQIVPVPEPHTAMRYSNNPNTPLNIDQPPTEPQ